MNNTPRVTEYILYPSFIYMPLTKCGILLQIEPYMMWQPVMHNQTAGNGQYYGYIAELLATLADRVGFTYHIHQVPDKEFGYRKDDGSWDGMIGKLDSKL